MTINTIINVIGIELVTTDIQGNKLTFRLVTESTKEPSRRDEPEVEGEPKDEPKDEPEDEDEDRLYKWVIPADIEFMGDHAWKYSGIPTPGLIPVGTHFTFTDSDGDTHSGTVKWAEFVESATGFTQRLLLKHRDPTLTDCPLEDTYDSEQP